MDKFELALTQVSLIPEHSLSIVLAGLDHHTQMHVRMFNPTSIAYAANLAKLHESSKEPLPKNPSRFSPFNKTLPLTSNPNPKINPPSPQTPSNSTNKQKPLFYRSNHTISANEIEERKAKGLCFFRDEVFTPSHQLKHKRSHLMFMELDEDDTTLEDDT